MLRHCTATKLWICKIAFFFDMVFICRHFNFKCYQAWYIPKLWKNITHILAHYIHILFILWACVGTAVGLLLLMWPRWREPPPRGCSWRTGGPEPADPSVMLRGWREKPFFFFCSTSYDTGLVLLICCFPFVSLCSHVYVFMERFRN